MPHHSTAAVAALLLTALATSLPTSASVPPLSPLAAFAAATTAGTPPSSSSPAASSSSSSASPTLGVVPPGSLTHFCAITGWDDFNATLARYATLLGVPVPPSGVAGGPGSNGTYNGKPLVGTTKIAFMPLNNATHMEILAGDPAQPSWWRDVYLARGFEIHHMGYALPPGPQVWDVVARFQQAGLGAPVQWGRWGTLHKPGAGCYVYMDSTKTLGVTTEILANGDFCDSLPAPPPPAPGRL